MFSLPKNVSIIEVGPRDGLQNEKNVLSTATKVQFIHQLQQAGIQEMEVASFVSPKRVPQMADARSIMQQIHLYGRQYALAPNAKGIELASEANAKSIAIVVGVTDAFNQSNVNQTTEESIKAFKPLITTLKNDQIFVRACISTAFYCPFEGKVDAEKTYDVCARLVDMGVDELSVADTVGQANPVESYHLFQKLATSFPSILLTAHFHDTRKMAMANIFAALQAGVTRFDTSAGGLGGCPFAPGATGNVATEDVVSMLHSLGIDTGIQLHKLCEAIDTIAPYLSHPIDTAMYRLYLQTFEDRK